MTELYARRRQALIERHAELPILIRGAAARGVNPNLFYLTGLAEPRAALLLAPQGVRFATGAAHPGPGYVSGRIGRQLLFVPRPDLLAQRWGEQSGCTLGTLSAAELGVDAVLATDELGGVLARILDAQRSLAYVRSSAAGLEGPDDDDTHFVERIRRRFFDARFVDATAAVHAMRQVKDAEEVDSIARALEVTREALDRVQTRARGGLREYEVEAEIVATYRAHGAEHAFEPIVACGSNGLILHYRDNAGLLSEGELLLVDTGARLDHYCCDITRTYPVGGRFSDRQREVYSAVLRAQEAAIAACRSGASLSEVHETAYRSLAQDGFAQHFVHGTSHHLGLETHDAGDVHRPLEPGAVVTVEPGAYIAEEGIGIRIEDDVLVTDAGPRVLSEAIPKSIEAIESGMHERAS